jgi:hypothetical protein
LGRPGQLVPGGGWRETDAGAQAWVQVADIGKATVGPSSRLRLVASGEQGHRLELARGRIEATVVAPPRLFVVDTPSARAVDLGCHYTLAVDERGDGWLEVHLGFVALEVPGRPSAIVPEGARCAASRGRGPGVPHRFDAPGALRDALADLHAEPADPLALERALAACEDEDALSLWHLLARVPLAARPRVYEGLVAGRDPPVGVTRAATLALEAKALEAWRLELGLGW